MVFQIGQRSVPQSANPNKNPSQSATTIIRVATKTLSAWLLVAVLNATRAASAGKLVAFPGPLAQLPSPHGRYVVENVVSDKEPHHTLRLKDSGTGAVHTLCTYQRHVTVLWSPNGKKFVVNDYAGSDFSKVLIFSVDQDGRPEDVGAGLLQSLKNSPDWRKLADNDHVYFAVSSWDGNRAVTLKVWGHGKIEAKGFSRL